MSYAKQVPAAERVLRLLETLANTPAGLSAGELEEALPFSRSSLFALLNTLKARHYIEQQGGSGGRYRLGPALYALMPTRQQELAPLLEAFHTDPELRAHTETIALTRLDGPDAVIFAHQDGSRPVRVVLTVGQRRPAPATADGLILLAGLPPETLEQSLFQQKKDLAATLAQIQKKGWSQTRNEETVEVAYPICADGHQPTAALLMTMPAFRWEATASLFTSLRNVAMRLSYRLGAPAYQPYGRASGQPVGPTTPLSETELADFLKGPWGARLACIRPDGTPHVVPLWYEWDSRFFWITASPNANWGQYIRQNAWVSLTIDEPWPPLRRALITGHTQPVPDETVPGGTAGLRQRLAGRYLGRGTASADPQDRGQWQAFRITPQKIVGQRGLGK